MGGQGARGYGPCLSERLILGDANGDVEVLGVETVEEEEALFVDDVSDIDMDELLQGTQRPKEVAEVQGSMQGGDPDEFEDEMAALNDMDFDM